MKGKTQEKIQSKIKLCQLNLIMINFLTRENDKRND